MPAITPGRSSTSQTGKIAGRRSRKLKPAPVRREQTASAQRQTTAQVKRQRTAAAPANRRADAEKTRRDTLARGNRARQLGLDARNKQPTREPTRTLIGSTSRTTNPPVSGKPTSDAVVAILKGAGKVLKKSGEGFEKAFTIQSHGAGVGSPQMALQSTVPALPDKLVKGTINDAYQFPAQIVPSTLQTAGALNELRKGNPKPINELLKEADKTDPVWNSLAAAANLVKGDTKAANKRAKQAAKSVEEHPGLAAIEVFATKGATGRGITRGGSATRRVAESRVAEKVAPKTSKRVAAGAKAISSTERASARLPGTNLVVHRQHSRDAFQRYADRKSDKSKSSRAADLRDQAKDADATDPRRALGLREQARRVDPEIIRGKQIRRAVDEDVDANEQVRRRNRGRVVSLVRKEIKGAKRGGPITSLLTQRITRADLGELREYRDRIKAEGDGLDPLDKNKIAANTTLVRDLTKAIGDVESGKVNLPRLERIANAYAERSRAGQQQLVDRKLIDPDRAERAAAIPHAAAQMGARNDPETLKAFAVAAASEAEKAKGKAQSAKSKKTALGGAQRVQRAHEPTAAIKRDASMKPARADLPLPSRGQSVTAWIKAIEDLDDEHHRPVPSFEDFKETAPKSSRSSDDPTVEGLTANVKPGQPGISIDPTHVIQRDRVTKEPTGWGPEMPGEKVVVHRDEDGKPIGALSILTGPNGRPDLLQVAVEPGHRGKGVASELYRYAQQHGYDVEAASGRGGYTEQGTRLAYKRLVERHAAAARKPSPVERAIKRGDKRERKMKAATAKVEQTEGTARKARKKSARANQRVREDPLVLPGGKPLPTKKIMDRLADRLPAFLTQAPGQRGARNFYVPSDRPPSITGQRTHRATVEGTFDADPEVMVEQAARTQGLVDAFDGFKRMIDRYGRREDGGELMQRASWKEANQLAMDTSREGQKWVAIRINPLGASKEQLARMVDQDSPREIVDALGNATKEGDDGPWTIVPHDAADQITKHMNVGPNSDWLKAWQQGTGVFRKTVLATSPTWFLGNVGEGTMRSILSQAGPRSYLTGRRVNREARRMDPEGAKLAEARTLGTGHYGFAERSQVHHDLQQYEDGLVRNIGAIGGRALRAPGPKHVKAGWDIWTHAVMNGVNKVVENQFQTAMLGKAVRNERSGAGKRQIAHRPKVLMTKRAQELSSKAAEEAARGVLDPNTAAALGREIDRMYGRYSKFSPAQREFIAGYTPFIAWTLNAAKFVGRLPVDHPVFAAVSAALEQQSEEWRKTRGLAMFIPGSVPEFLQGSIPDGKGGHYRAPTRYTPLSIGSDPIGTAASAVLPQVNGVLMAMRGMDWKGDQLRDENGKKIEGLAKAPEAIKAFAKSTIPVLGIGTRVEDKGVGGVFGLKALAQYTAPAKPKGGGGGAAKVADPLAGPPALATGGGGGGTVSPDGFIWK